MSCKLSLLSTALPNPNAALAGSIILVARKIPYTVLNEETQTEELHNSIDFDLFKCGLDPIWGKGYCWVDWKSENLPITEDFLRKRQFTENNIIGWCWVLEP